MIPRRTFNHLDLLKQPKKQLPKTPVSKAQHLKNDPKSKTRTFGFEPFASSPPRPLRRLLFSCFEVLQQFGHLEPANVGAWKKQSDDEAKQTHASPQQHPIKKLNKCLKSYKIQGHCHFLQIKCPSFSSINSGFYSRQVTGIGTFSFLMRFAWVIKVPITSHLS